MCSVSPLKRYADSSPTGRHELPERQFGVLGIKRYVVSRMGQEHGKEHISAVKVDRAGPKSRSVIRIGEESNSVALKTSLL